MSSFPKNHGRIIRIHNGVTDTIFTQKSRLNNSRSRRFKTTIGAAKL